jgi:hypothetical protein
MSIGTTRPDVKIILRHIDPPESAREYALEATAAEEQRYF